MTCSSRFAVFKCVLLFTIVCATTCEGADVEKILAKMSLKQKIGQMVMGDVSDFSVGGDPNSVRPSNLIREFSIGFLFDTTGRTCAESIKMSKSIWDQLALPLQDGVRVPVAIAMDAVRGPAFLFDPTLFPHNINLAATWNVDLAFEQGRITGRDMRNCGWHLAMAPAADNGNEPLWGRHYETFGSQPLAAAVFARKLIEGIQSPDNSSSLPQCAATLKHWIGYGLPDSGRDRSAVTVSPSVFERVVLPTQRGPLQTADPLVVMINSGPMNGVPLHADKVHVREMLQRQFNFSGLVLSDFDDFFNMARRGYAKSNRESVKMALEAGLDVHLTENLGEETMRTIFDLVSHGDITEARIDESVRRILKLKDRLGLLDGVEGSAGRPEKIVSEVWSPMSREISKRIAEQSITLLLNRDRTLPLAPNTDSLGPSRRVLVTGPTAASVASMCGGWLFNWGGLDGNPSIKNQNITTLVAGIKARTERLKWSLSYEKGSELKTGDGQLLSRATQAAGVADFVVVAVGEPAYSEMFEPIDDLSLYAPQLQLVRELRGAIDSRNKNRNLEDRIRLILVLFAGRPRLLDTLAPLCDAILQAYLPCFEGGNAVASVLFGELNPSGRLPYPYPKKATAQRLELDPATVTGTWLPFGFGLSYSSFNYSNLMIQPPALTFQRRDASTETDAVSVTVDVCNNSTLAGNEVVFLRIREPLEPSSSFWMVLKRFRRVEQIEPNTCRRIKFILFGADFRFLVARAEQEQTVEVTVGPLTGQFVLQVGGGPEQNTFDITEGDNLQVVHGVELSMNDSPNNTPLDPLSPDPQGSAPDSPFDSIPQSASTPHLEPAQSSQPRSTAALQIEPGGLLLQLSIYFLFAIFVY